MAYTYRPDLLPFALPTRLGLPYHGLVTDGKLALPGGATKTYAQPADGSTTLVRHPRSSAPDPDTAHPEYTWQNYALLSGSAHQIGGQDLGADKWIYCDDDYSWVVGVEYSNAGAALTISIYVYAPFGLFRTGTRTYTKRLLASATVMMVDREGTPITYQTVQSSASTHSAIGAKTALNFFGTLPDTGYEFWRHAGILCSAAITLSGNGDINAAACGSGLSASISTSLIPSFYQSYVQEDDLKDGAININTVTGKLTGADTVYEGLDDDPYTVRGTMVIGSGADYGWIDQSTVDYEEVSTSCYLYVTQAGVFGNAVTMQIKSGFKETWSYVRAGERMYYAAKTNLPPRTTEGEETVVGTETYFNGLMISGTVFGASFSGGYYSKNACDISWTATPVWNDFIPDYDVSFSADCVDSSDFSGVDILRAHIAPHNNNMIDAFWAEPSRFEYVKTGVINGTSLERAGKNCSFNPSTQVVTVAGSLSSNVCWV